MALLSHIRPLLEKFLKSHQSLHCRSGKTRAGYDEDVVSSAALLQISEFRFFHLAYERWFGHVLSDRDMEHIYVPYLFDSVVPYWVRHLVREVLSLEKQASLNPADFNIKHRTITPEIKAQGEWYIIAVFMILVMFCFLLAGHVPP